MKSGRQSSTYVFRRQRMSWFSLWMFGLSISIGAHPSEIFGSRPPNHGGHKWLQRYLVSKIRNDYVWMSHGSHGNMFWYVNKCMIIPFLLLLHPTFSSLDGYHRQLGCFIGSVENWGTGGEATRCTGDTANEFCQPTALDECTWASEDMVRLPGPQIQNWRGSNLKFKHVFSCFHHICFNFHLFQLFATCNFALFFHCHFAFAFFSPTYSTCFCGKLVILHVFWGNWKMVVAIVAPSFILFCCCFYWTIVWLFPKSHGKWARTSLSGLTLLESWRSGVN